MTVVIDRLVHRAPRAVETAAACSGCTLAELPRGGAATIVGPVQDAPDTVARRLFDLGFVPGARVELLRRAPMADPMIFSVAGYEIALRRAQARLIDVEPAA